MEITEALILMLLCALGFFAHVLKSMKQVGPNGWDMSIGHYLKKYPKQTALAAIGVVGVMAGLYEMEQLNMTTAFATGYMANSAADGFAGRTLKQMR